MATLSLANPHFVRCIKPNVQKKQNLFEHQVVLNQLKYSGVWVGVPTFKVLSVWLHVQLMYSTFWPRVHVPHFKQQLYNYTVWNVCNRYSMRPSVLWNIQAKVRGRSLEGELPWDCILHKTTRISHATCIIMCFISRQPLTYRVIIII